MRLTPLVAVVAAALVGCGGAAPTQKATPASHPAPSSTAAVAACAKLRGSALPAAAYDQLLIREAGELAGGGSASGAQVRAAKAKVAAEIRGSCPRFAYLLPRR